MKPSELLEQREQEVRELGNVHPSYFHDEFGTMVILKATHTKNGRKRGEHLASGESRRKTQVIRNEQGWLIGFSQDINDEVMGEAIALGRALKMYHKLYDKPRYTGMTLQTSGVWVTPDRLTIG